MRKNILIIFIACFTVASWAQVTLVKDIYPGFFGDSKEDPIGVHEILDNAAYFTAQNELNGEELWRSDGTEVGTKLIKDIYSGEEGSEINVLRVVGNSLFFYANDGINGQELWYSDGTESGTNLVKDIASGSAGSFFNSTAFAVLGNKLYFAANDGVNGVELWESDGTESGTQMVIDIVLGADGGNPRDFAVYNGHLYFFSNNSLWKSDGTAAGTTMLSDAVKDETIIIPASNGFFFLGYAADTGEELWFSDGTMTGTRLVKDIFDGTVFSGASLSREDKNFAVLNDKLLFVGYDQTNRSQLWISDGTEDGTEMLTDLSTVGDGGEFRTFTQVGDKIFFAGNGMSLGREPWVTDGTKEGTYMIKDLEEGFRGSSGFEPQYVAFRDKLFFYAEIDGQEELWETDGTPENTYFVANPNPTGRFDVGDFMVLNDTVLLFFGDDDIHGRELMKFSEPQALSVSIQVENGIACASDTNGELEALGVGGYPPYNFFWQDGSINRQSINNLSPGEYTVTVVDSRVTINDDTLVLVDPTPIQIGNPTIVNETSNQSNGSIEVSSVSGGTPPYTILWSNGDTTFTLSNLMAGTYDFTVTDANGCEISSSAIIDNVTSTKESLISSVSIYPTLIRSGEQLQIKNLPHYLKHTVEIYNSTGQVVLRQSNNQGEKALDISTLKPSNYFLRLVTDDAFITRHFVVIP